MGQLTNKPCSFAPGAICDPEGLHRQLAHWNRRRLAPAAPAADWEEQLREAHRMQWLEGVWVETLRADIAPLLEDLPSEEDPFVAWFEQLKPSGPGQGDPLFEWLARDADLEAMKWFLTQEAAGEAGFEDLVALAQIKVPVAQAKLELAR